jgi:hypothetical protein
MSFRFSIDFMFVFLGPCESLRIQRELTFLSLSPCSFLSLLSSLGWPVQKRRQQPPVEEEGYKYPPSWLRQI